MTLIAFAANDGLTYVFAGTDRNAILRDTWDGTRFGFATLRRGTALGVEEVERMALPFYPNAVGAVARARRDRRSLSYFVGAALNIGHSSLAQAPAMYLHKHGDRASALTARAATRRVE